MEGPQTNGVALKIIRAKRINGRDEKDNIRIDFNT